MQRDSIPNHYIPILIFADGLVSVCFAIFAHTLGMDPTPDWGRSRLFLFLLGMALIITALVLFKQRTSFTSAETTKTVVLFAHLWAFIFIIYTWYITFGTFTEWRASTHYYSLLADAFGKGQLHVDVEPGAALLAAADPYNSEGRPAFDDDVWDLSLYKGKLYLYWGPVPAVLMTPVQLVLKTRLADMYPVFFFLCGLLIFNSLIIVKIWRKFFTDIPAWNIIVSIFVVGLVLPIPWSLSIPDVYEAAIGAGQFFLIGGIYFIILAFENEVKKRYLFLAGLFLGMFRWFASHQCHPNIVPDRADCILVLERPTQKLDDLCRCPVDSPCCRSASPRSLQLGALRLSARIWSALPDHHLQPEPRHAARLSGRLPAIQYRCIYIAAV
ncbi:MAG: hypothetical protein IPG80_20735 [Anaerolineales bacterium]|uniref:hypothetical protein n=1 Tax=Candidatus Villigracilis vicinus TaxID=3140679 RepID=UPI003135939F|nr:hypothetical protein [Anaerolineales bacterium]